MPNLLWCGISGECVESFYKLGNRNPQYTAIWHSRIRGHKACGSVPIRGVRLEVMPLKRSDLLLGD